MAGIQTRTAYFHRLAVLIFSTALTAAGDPLDQWRSPNPLPQANLLIDVGYADHLWVAVGSNGTITTSPDGINWTPRASGVAGTVSGISHSKGQWVAVAIDQPEFGSVFLTSPDGIAWTKRIPGEKFGLFAIGYGNGRWVAVGDGGVIISSGPAESAPRLSIRHEGQNAIVAWPADATGYVLESTTDLTAPQTWTATSQTPSVVNSQKTIRDAFSASARFYRLRKE